MKFLFVVLSWVLAASAAAQVLLPVTTSTDVVTMSTDVQEQERERSELVALNKKIGLLPPGATVPLELQQRRQYVVQKMQLRTYLNRFHEELVAEVWLIAGTFGILFIWLFVRHVGWPHLRRMVLAHRPA